MMRRLLGRFLGSAVVIGAILAPGQAGGQAAPDSSVAMVGTTLISVHYGAPSTGGQQVFGALVPYGQTWGTGGAEATTFRTLRPLKVGDVTVPKGLYTLFTIPAAAERDCNGTAPAGSSMLILSRQSGGALDASQEAARVPMRACRLDSPVERLSIRVLPASGSTGTLRIEWERTRYDVPFSLAR
jgi:hypothetical protein